MKMQRSKVKGQMKDVMIGMLFLPVVFYLLSGIAYAVEAKVAVAKGLIKRGQVLKADDIEVEDKQFNRMPFDVITELDNIVEKVAKIDIRPGIVIRPNMLETRKLIKRGENVKIVAESGLLKVTADGQAVEDGREGKFIKVINLSSKKMIVGKVVDESTVAVRF